MRIIFIRHGEPNYEQDCLTETGRRQAEAVSLRLEGEGISEVFSSPMGRAKETASYTAGRLNLPVKVLDYMHEISWGGPGVPEEGHPWTVSNAMITEDDFDFFHEDWRKHPAFERNVATEYVDRLGRCFDGLLEQQGYRHEGTRYFCTAGEQKTFAVFSHGGSGACVLSHLLALPFPYVCTVLPYDFTSVIILEFPVAPGEYVHPRIELFNDCAHLKGQIEGPVFQQQPDRT